MDNQVLSKKRWQTAYQVAKWLQLAPFIRMVGVNGSMVTGNLREESDIDFLVITHYGRIWTGRFFVTLITHLMGKRRHGQKVAGRVCLNRYQTDQSLEVLPHDEYHARIFSSLVPILDLGDLYPRYQKANQWMEKLGFLVSNKTPYQPLPPAKFLGSIRRFLEKLLEGKGGDWLEEKLGTWQKNRIQNDIRTLKAPQGRVRVSDKELCFHPLKEPRGS